LPSHVRSVAGTTITTDMGEDSVVENPCGESDEPHERSTPFDETLRHALARLDQDDVRIFYDYFDERSLVIPALRSSRWSSAKAAPCPQTGRQAAASQSREREIGARGEQGGQQLIFASLGGCESRSPAVACEGETDLSVRDTQAACW
jgi:hypothetical protein